MKNISIIVTALLLSVIVAGAAKIPSPTSVRFHITCTVAEKAEWITDTPIKVDALSQTRHLQPEAMTPALVVNAHQDPNESIAEIADNGTFRDGGFPVDIITVTQPANRLKPAIKTLTACWKI